MRSKFGYTTLSKIFIFPSLNIFYWGFASLKHELEKRKKIASQQLITWFKRLHFGVHSSFWHGCKKHGSIPKTNTKFWKDKINENIKRREKVKAELKKEGFTVLEYYECDLRKNMAGIIDEITQYFRS